MLVKLTFFGNRKCKTHLLFHEQSSYWEDISCLEFAEKDLVWGFFESNKSGFIPNASDAYIRLRYEFRKLIVNCKRLYNWLQRTRKSFVCNAMVDKSYLETKQKEKVVWTTLDSFRSFISTNKPENFQFWKYFTWLIWNWKI